MQKNNKLTAKRITFSVVGLILLVFVLNPKWIPFAGEDTKEGLQAMIAVYAGQFRDAVQNAAVNADRLIGVLLVFVMVYIVRTLNALVFKCIHFKSRHQETLKILLESIISYGVVIGGVIISLSLLGVNMVALFASVGIASLIVGFSAQQIIYDIISGIFLIFEGQLNVGDIVSINGFRGTVAKIGIRTTQLLDIGGNIQIINNSDIKNVQNLSQKRSVAVCDIGMSYNQPLEEAEQVIEKTIPYIQKKYPDMFPVAPEYMGVQNLGSSSVLLRISADVEEGNLYQAKRVMNREFKLAFDANGIEIPFDHLVIMNGKEEVETVAPMGNIMSDTNGFKVNMSRYDGGAAGAMDDPDDSDDE